MDCTTVSSRVAAFLDGEMDAGECERFVLHIEACDPCTRLVAKLEAQRFSPWSEDEKPRSAVAESSGVTWTRFWTPTWTRWCS